MKFLKLLSLCISLCAMQAAAAAEEKSPAEPLLKPYSATYSVGWGRNVLGEGVITLSADGDPDCYRFESRTHPIAPVRWFYGSPRETSLFCVRDGQIRPKRFEYFNDKREKDNFTLDFDWFQRKVKTLYRGELTQRDLPEAAYDRFVIQLAGRLWAQQQQDKAQPEPLELVMIDDDRIATYRFVIAGLEKVETPAGRFEALRVDRVDRKDKSLHSWLAPERDYLPVKIEKIEDGEVTLRMLLK